jgi:hypothetical protein
MLIVIYLYILIVIYLYMLIVIYLHIPIARWQRQYWLRHGFDEMPASTRFPRTQLYHLHRHFRHPDAAKMYELLKGTKAEDLSPDTLAVLRGTSEHC